MAYASTAEGIMEQWYVAFVTPPSHAEISDVRDLARRCIWVA